MNEKLNFNSSFGVNFGTFHDVNTRKKQKQEDTKEGVVVNTFIKDSDSSSEPTFIPQKTSLPADMFVKKENISGNWLNNPTIPLIAAPLLILGVGAGLTAIYKKSMTSKYKLGEKLRLPSQGRVITINNDNSMALLMLVQDPSQRNLQVAAAVIAASATAFIMKNAVDGFKEIWVKKQVADIKRDKEEKLIDIETRSFSGKNQIIRSLIEQKTSEINSYKAISDNPENPSIISFAQFKNKLSFKSTENKENNVDKEEKKSSGKALLYFALGIVAMGLAALFTKAIFKNLGKVAKNVEEKASELSKNFKADLKILKTSEELEQELENSKISSQAKDMVREKWAEIHDPSRISAPPAELTNYKGKTGFSSFVLADMTSFIYTWLINKNPQTKTLAMLMCTAGGLGYLGQTAVKGVKEVQVEKANAKTEVELQDRLVQVELKNFYQKKKSYIEPLMENYKQTIKQKPSKENINKIKENVLSEIKNGPPFVYS